MREHQFLHKYLDSQTIIFRLFLDDLRCMRHGGGSIFLFGEEKNKKQKRQSKRTCLNGGFFDLFSFIFLAL